MPLEGATCCLNHPIRIHEVRHVLWVEANTGEDLHSKTSQNCCCRTSTLLPLLHVGALKVGFCLLSTEWKLNSPQLPERKHVISHFSGLEEPEGRPSSKTCCSASRTSLV